MDGPDVRYDRQQLLLGIVTKFTQGQTFRLTRICEYDRRPARYPHHRDPTIVRVFFAFQCLEEIHRFMDLSDLDDPRLLEQGTIEIIDTRHAGGMRCGR
ncbi:hypothetical protein D3C84_669150 [compost metagenome]